MYDFKPVKYLMYIMVAAIIALLIAVVILAVALGKKGEAPVVITEDIVFEDAGPRFKWYDGGNGHGETIYVDTETGVLYIHKFNTMGSHWGSVIVDTDGLPMLAEGYSR